MGSLSTLITHLFMGSDSTSTFNRPEAWLVNGFGGSKTKSGITVGTEKAKTIAAVFASIRNISEDLAKIPLKVYGRTDRGKLENSTIPAARVIANPNSDLTAFSFRESLTALCLGWGNGFAEIVRDGSDRPSSLELIHPSRVKPVRTNDGLVYEVHAGDIDIFGLTGQNGSVIPIPQRDMIHIRGHGDDILGKSVIQMGAESMGIALAAQQQAASFFGKGMSPSGMFVYPEKLDEKARTNLREYLQKTYGGSENAGKQLVLWGGMQYQQISVSPEDAQLLESRVFQNQEIARWFRIPLSKIQDTSNATYSNVEQESLQYVTDTLHAWAARIEQEFQRKLFLKSDTKHFVKHKLQALVRGDMKTRGEFYKSLFNMGAITPDEIRSLEEMNTIGSDASESLYLQGGMSTIEHIHAGDNLKSANVPRGTDDDETTDTEGDDVDEEKASVPDGMKSAMAGLVERCLTRQHRACANSKKQDQKAHAEWSKGFFLKERTIMEGALDNVFAEIGGQGAEDAKYMIKEHCRDSAARGEPANTVNELTDQLLGALYG